VPAKNPFGASAGEKRTEKGVQNAIGSEFSRQRDSADAERLSCALCKLHLATEPVYDEETRAELWICSL